MGVARPTGPPPTGPTSSTTQPAPNAARQAQAQTPSSAANHLAIPAHQGGPCRRDQTPGKLGRFGAALAGAGHSLQKASCRWLNARFTAKLKAGCSVSSSDIARSMAGYRTADAWESVGAAPQHPADGGAIATGCGATGASSSSTVLMPLAMAAAFSGACAIWLEAPCTSSRASSSRWVG